jgi:tRNA 2-thiouridine synthesizing protein A
MAMKFEKKAEGLFQLDVTGYVCPHPQIYTKKALEKMKHGEIVELIFDNPSSSESIAAMCEAQGNEIVEKSMLNGKYLWKIKKTVEAAAALAR